MLDYVSDIAKNIAYYLKTHPPFGTPPEGYNSAYENNSRLDQLIMNHPLEVRMWLDHVFNNDSAIRR